MTEKNDNPMRQIQLEKVTVNMGLGQTGEELEKGVTIVESITGVKSVRTTCKVKNPTWGIRPGLTIGVKTTLRGEKADAFLENALSAKDKQLRKRNFDRNGNFGFGIKEHIDLPNVKYDPKQGIKGFDVLVSLKRPGFRIRKRKLNKNKIPKHHAISKDEAMEFIKQKYGVEVK